MQSLQYGQQIITAQAFARSLDNFTNIIPPLIHILLDQVTWLCNGDFVKESERKMSKLEPMEGANKWRASLVITVCVFGVALKLGQEDG